MCVLQERRLQDEGGESQALSAYYAPTRSDAFVLAFRRWLKEYAGSRVQWPEGVDLKLPPVQTKRQLMDRSASLRMPIACLIIFLPERCFDCMIEWSPGEA